MPKLEDRFVELYKRVESGTVSRWRTVRKITWALVESAILLLIAVRIFGIAENPYQTAVFALLILTYLRLVESSSTLSTQQVGGLLSLQWEALLLREAVGQVVEEDTLQERAETSIWLKRLEPIVLIHSVARTVCYFIALWKLLWVLL